MTAGATAFVRNQHIRIELFADGGTPARRRRLAIISHSLVVAFFLLPTILSARMALDEYHWGDHSTALGLPTWWSSMWMHVLFFAISIHVAGILRRLLRGTPCSTIT